MPVFLCRPIAPEIRPNTTFQHGGAEYGGQSARTGALFGSIRPESSAWAESTRKSDMGLIPIKLGVASGQRGDASFFGARCVGVVERAVPP
jgi:hypothetical protein